MARSYEEFIASGEFVFRARDNADPPWQRRQVQLEMVPTSDGEVAGVGLEILILDDDGRIRIDDQFIEA